MRLFYYTILAGSLAFTAQSSIASQSPSLTLEELLAVADPVKAFEDIIQRNPQNAGDLCSKIKDPSFYGVAEAAKLGVLKRNKLINLCSGVNYKVIQQGTIVQKEKPAEKPREAVKLKPVNLGQKSSNIESEQAALQSAQATMLENAELLGKKAEFEAKLTTANNEIKQAKEHYDNLALAISFLRDDLKQIRGFMHFNPNAHDADTPEAYLGALNQALGKEARSILTQESREQLGAASQLLQQANENLAAARKDLEAINREMLQLTH